MREWKVDTKRIISQTVTVYAETEAAAVKAATNGQGFVTYSSEEFKLLNVFCEGEAKD